MQAKNLKKCLYFNFLAKVFKNMSLFFVLLSYKDLFDVYKCWFQFVGIFFPTKFTDNKASPAMG